MILPFFFSFRNELLILRQVEYTMLVIEEPCRIFFLFFEGVHLEVFCFFVVAQEVCGTLGSRSLSISVFDFFFLRYVYSKFYWWNFIGTMFRFDDSRVFLHWFRCECWELFMTPRADKLHFMPWKNNIYDWPCNFRPDVEVFVKGWKFAVDARTEPTGEDQQWCVLATCVLSSWIAGK